MTDANTQPTNSSMAFGDDLDEAESVSCAHCGAPGPWNQEPYPGLCGVCADRQWKREGNK